MRKFLHIAFNFQSRPPKIDELMPAFGNAIDWVRYAPNCWIVLTTSDVFVWYQRLKPLVHDDDSIFICEVDMNAARAGYLPNLVWTWLEQKTEQKTENIRPILALPGPEKNDLAQ